MPRAIEIVTPFDPKDLLFHTMHGREEVGRLSEYQLGLLSLKDNLDLNTILGQKVTVKLELPDQSFREFTGYVTRFAQQGLYGRYTAYVATVRPWLWFLSRTADCKIFQELTVPDIVKLVLADHPAADVKWQLSGTYRTWTYCVQYRETDLNFVSRLFEQEGIYYYFKNAGGKNTMVITDSYGGHEPFPKYEDLAISIDSARVVRPDVQHITSWEIARQVQPGLYVHDDYDFERPSLELLTSKPLPRPYSPSDYEVFDYPGSYVKKPEGQIYSAVRIEEYGAQFEAVNASTNARGLSVGHLVKVHDHPRRDQNAEYLVLSANYDLEFSDYEAIPDRGGSGYACTFTAMPSKQQFRASRLTPKPVMQGPQTAVVVGPPGEEIHTDKYGRVKVQFHWDRYGKRDQNSSCWIRVSHPWAGRGWGAMSLPRIGQEVVVDFLEGDPDQPLITGRVYNAEQRVPYALPTEQTKSTMKTDSSKGSGGFNEFRFEDKKGAEQIYLHGEKDLDIVVKNERRESVTASRHLTVGGSRLESVGADHHLKVAGDANHDTGTQHSLKVGTDLVLDAGKNITEKAGMEIYINAGMSIVIEAGMDLTLKGPGGFVNIGPAGVTIQGTMVLINSGGAAGTGHATSAKAPKAPKKATDKP
ncbi:MAG: type VI secretion system tip protein VgrG [Vicinamibacterales bacterium]